MPIDPLGGRIDAPTDAAPYENALIVTPDDDRDLPVIPSAICIPPTVPAIWSGEIGTDGGIVTDPSGEIIDPTEGDLVTVQNEYPWQWGCGDLPATIAMIGQNGEALTITAPSAIERAKQPILILPFRPRRILRTGTTVHRLILLW